MLRSTAALVCLWNSTASQAPNHGVSYSCRTGFRSQVPADFTFGPPSPTRRWLLPFPGAAVCVTALCPGHRVTLYAARPAQGANTRPFNPNCFHGAVSAAPRTRVQFLERAGIVNKTLKFKAELELEALLPVASLVWSVNNGEWNREVGYCATRTTWAEIVIRDWATLAILLQKKLSFRGYFHTATLGTCKLCTKKQLEWLLPSRRFSDPQFLF